MWLYEAANNAAKQAKERVVQVQEKASLIVAHVQDEANTILNAMSLQEINPVDEIIFEELEDYKAFQDVFDLDDKTEEVASILKEDEYISDLHTAMVPEQLSYKEFWTRYYFRQFTKQRQEEEQAKREEARRIQLKKEQEAREGREREAREAYETQLVQDRIAAEAAEDVAMWKEQVEHLQQVIRALEQNEESKYKSLCDEYESKMLQMTVHIDDAKASGYEEGIAESEHIISKIRTDTQQEHDEVRNYILQLLDNSTSSFPSHPATTIITPEMAAQIWSLRHSETSTMDSDVSKSKEEHHGNELDLWKARAMKMKKLKDEADMELAKAKEEATLAFTKGQEDAKRACAEQIQALEKALEAQRVQSEALPPAATTARSLPTEELDTASEPSRDDWGEWD
ncbi:hypothetical protein THRCLA_03467 [Thraustotheca clavata]|uniref:BSD domain-containing protein n=1 Tax=Thraustotheca clavata TaxID=74557 RepID=A0A1W0A1Z8_9STRA|nr:hypothetical protein THRCLA_03467 [Thraustotheca clavata]